MEKLSVTIITLNEEDNIRDALESDKWADEIVIVDDNSTDSTVEIARNYTDRIVQKKMNIEGKDLLLVSISKANTLVMTDEKSVYIRKGSHSVKADTIDLTNLVMSLNLIDTEIIRN